MVADPREDALQGVADAGERQTERSRHGGRHQRRVVDGGQLDPPDAVGEVVGKRDRRGFRGAGLADSASAGDGDDASLADSVADRRDIALPPNKVSLRRAKLKTVRVDGGGDEVGMEPLMLATPAGESGTAGEGDTADDPPSATTGRVNR